MENNNFPQEIKDAMALESLANECSVLMAVLCDKMGLKKRGVTQVEFCERFTEIQTKSLDAMKFLSENFILPKEIKQRKKRESKVVSMKDSVEDISDY